MVEPLTQGTAPGPVPGEDTRPRLPQHSLDYNFYRKFYSTYNIFQQKGNIQESWCTLLLQKQTEVLGREGKEVWLADSICTQN